MKEFILCNLPPLHNTVSHLILSHLFGVKYRFLLQTIVFEFTSKQSENIYFYSNKRMLNFCSYQQAIHKVKMFELGSFHCISGGHSVCILSKCNGKKYCAYWLLYVCLFPKMYRDQNSLTLWQALRSLDSVFNPLLFKAAYFKETSTFPYIGFTRTR